MPRPVPVIDEEKQRRPATPWSFPKSIFADYRHDTEDLMA